jgi:hypothetical protein
LAITCLLLGALAKRSDGLTFRNPRGSLEFKRIGEANVDDTELWLALDDCDLFKMASEMQDVAQF